MTEIDVQDRQVETGRGLLFARSWGSLDDSIAPILLFHDSLGSVELWRGFPEKLAVATGRRVIAYDRLGFGRSDPFQGRLAIDFVLEEARQIVPLLQRQLGFSSFIACGHSVGGGMAVETAAYLQEDCVGLITMGAQAFVDDRIRDGIRVAQAEFAKPENLVRLSRYHRDPAWVVDAWIGTWLDPAFAGFSLDEALAQVDCPVLAVHGRDDEYGSVDHARRIAAGRGEVAILDGIGHVPHREDPDRLVGLLDTFIREAVFRG
ncbi:alpha/beta fold hydrolase [Bosea beijingensis]|uniref:alpha/beta fold hydrolase n=1 Tax=Bosea beijingensis TaxID=3068632 RepID=UPI002742044E|nr:alpha/beta hydrolase [Bosea sp. REN20]